jgi:hypothetical protein
MRRLTSQKIDRKYYLVGSVVSGKSTTLEALRCFQTFEEWAGRVPPEMYLNDRKLSVKEQKVVDDFVFPQLITKNNRMMRQAPGIRIMDRAFHDLFAFSKSRKEVLRKAKELHRRFREQGKRFEDGHVFFIRASAAALAERMARRGVAVTKSGKTKGFDANALLVQERKLAKIYKPETSSIFDTSESTVGETAKQIARKILLERYAEFAFQERLEQITSRDGKL